MRNLELEPDFEPEHGKMGHLVLEAARQVPAGARPKARHSAREAWRSRQPASGTLLRWPAMSAFLKACRGEPTSYTPIWLMRQAGRYQPEYRAIRAKVSFVELCKTPDLAAEVTLLPVTQLGVDAAILFADILLVLEPLGIGFEFTKGDGPLIEQARAHQRRHRRGGPRTSTRATRSAT